jgi:hypothetical protein
MKYLPDQKVGHLGVTKKKKKVLRKPGRFLKNGTDPGKEGTNGNSVCDFIRRILRV